MKTLRGLLAGLALYAMATPLLGQTTASNTTLEHGKFAKEYYSGVKIGLSYDDSLRFTPPTVGVIKELDTGTLAAILDASKISISYFFDSHAVETSADTSGELTLTYAHSIGPISASIDQDGTLDLSYVNMLGPLFFYPRIKTNLKDISASIISNIPTGPVNLFNVVNFSNTDKPRYTSGFAYVDDNFTVFLTTSLEGLFKEEYTFGLAGFIEF